MNRSCYLCGSTAELRPYGPKWELICFDCAMKPENVGTTEKMFMGQIESAGNGPVVIGTEAGPYPLKKGSK